MLVPGIGGAFEVVYLRREVPLILVFCTERERSLSEDGRVVLGDKGACLLLVLEMVRKG